MRPTTTTALALAGTALALPAGVALAETTDDPPSPAESALAAPFAGHLTLNAQMRAERREVLVERLTPRVIRTERKTARVKGADFSQRAEERRLRGDSPRELRAELDAEPPRAAPRRARRRDRPAPPPRAPTPPRRRTSRRSRPASPAATTSTNTGNGFYGGVPVHAGARGRRVGGTGNPAAAARAEQDRRAAMLYAQQGSSPWPVCGG